MEHVSERDHPRHFQQHWDEEKVPELVSGGFLLGSFVMCLDFWLLVALAVSWLT